MPGFMVVILIGAVVGFIARFLYPGPNTPHGLILTAVLGIIGATLATVIGHSVGLLESNKLADPISMVAAAIIVLFIWNRLAVYRIVRDPGIPRDDDSAPTHQDT